MTVILANGAFPRKGGAGWRLLEEATRVVACDGAAAAYRRRFGRWPAVTVGDLDSLSARNRPPAASVVKVVEQETNDLAKALRFCAARGWRDPVVVGATGRREDHAIGNVFRCLAAGVRLVTDCGTFHPVRPGRPLTLAAGVDRAVSVFAIDPETKMSSRGLRWPLDGVRFVNPFCATLNRTVSARFSVTSDRPAFVYVF